MSLFFNTLCDAEKGRCDPVSHRQRQRALYPWPMRIFVTAIVLTTLSLVCACGAEEAHEHDTEDFDSLAECQAHYEDEGHDADEIAELCEGLE
jgi:hypothetical protein